MYLVIRIILYILLLLLLLSNIHALTLTPWEWTATVDPIDVEERETSHIPKMIWTFWNSTTVPYVVQRCIDTWHTHCPDYVITIVTPTTLHEYIEDINLLVLPFSDTPQRLSDFVRLHILHKFGGFWLDATTIMIRNLDYFHYKQQLHPGVEVVGYYIDAFTTRQEFPVIENWFIGCIQGSRFMGWWKKEFMRINHFSSSLTYVENIRLSGIDLQRIGMYFGRYYLSMHVAAQSVLQGRCRVIDLLCLDKAEDGPFHYLKSHGWNTTRSMDALRDTFYDAPSPIVKFRVYERKYMMSPKNLHSIDQIISNLHATCHL
jgi:hypothetical protein